MVFSGVEYRSKEVRDATSKKMRDDPRMKEMGEGMKFIDRKKRRQLFSSCVAPYRDLERRRRCIRICRLKVALDFPSIASMHGTAPGR